MNLVLLKKTAILTVLLSYVTCANDDYLEVNEMKVLENTISNEKLNLDEIVKKWEDEFENYDLEKTLIEEQSVKINEPENELHRKRKQKSGKKVLVHYMPWFESLETDGLWGQHWTMTNKNPEIINSEGKREIAAHYYPIIGPYSTKDKDLQQYHLLLMKLSGVDGVIFDWYGKRNVLDFEKIKLGMESFIEELEKTDMEFAVMYEDRVISVQQRSLNPVQMNQAIDDIKYIEKNYFKNSNYIKEHGENLLMIFGPNYIDTSTDWSVILSSLKTPVNLLTLWGARNTIGTNNTSGEYAWIDKDHLQTLRGYYNNVIDFNTNMVGGVAYPRFNDFYVEGGWKSRSEEDWRINGNGVETFRESYKESLKHPVDFMQIATWNDFGEGTAIEPTDEFGFNHLELLQELTQVSYTAEDLAIPYYIYKLRKTYPNNTTVQFLMNRAHRRASGGKIKKAKFLIGLTMFYFGANLSL